MRTTEHEYTTQSISYSYIDGAMVVIRARSPESAGIPEFKTISPLSDEQLDRLQGLSLADAMQNAGYLIYYYPTQQESSIMAPSIVNSTPDEVQQPEERLIGLQFTPYPNAWQPFARILVVYLDVQNIHSVKYKGSPVFNRILWEPVRNLAYVQSYEEWGKVIETHELLVTTTLIIPENTRQDLFNAKEFEIPVLGAFISAIPNWVLERRQVQANLPPSRIKRAIPRVYLHVSSSLLSDQHFEAYFSPVPGKNSLLYITHQGLHYRHNGQLVSLAQNPNVLLASSDIRAFLVLPNLNNSKDSGVIEIN